MSKKISINELRKLVKETINETHRKSNKLSETKSRAKRERIIDSVITDTIKALRLFESLEDAEMESDESGMDQAPADGQPAEQTPGATGDGQTSNPYSDLVAEILGPPNAGDKYDVKSMGDQGAPLKTAKSKIKQKIKEFIQTHSKEGLQKAALAASDAADKIEFVTDSPVVAKNLRCSQMEVFMNQSVDGFVTRGPSFLKDIMSGTLKAASIWFSSDSPAQLIDGHHRSGSTIAANPNCTIVGTKMDANIVACLKILNLLLEIKAEGNAKVSSGDATKSIFNTPSTPAAVKSIWESCTGRSGQDADKAAAAAHPFDGDGPIPADIAEARKKYKKDNNLGGSDGFAPHTGRWRTKAATDMYSGLDASVRGKFMKDLDQEGAASPQDALNNWFEDCLGGPINQGPETPDMQSAPSTGHKTWDEVKKMYGNNVDSFAWHCANNLNAWPKPASQFPARQDMPQLDGSKGLNDGEPNTVKANLAGDGSQGTFDWNPPHVTTESIDLQRWSKLAGLLKD